MQTYTVEFSVLKTGAKERELYTHTLKAIDSGTAQGRAMLFMDGALGEWLQDYELLDTVHREWPR